MTLNPLYLLAPFALVLMGVEAYYSNRKAGKPLDFNETLANLNCGILAQSWKLLIYFALLPLYHLVYINLSITQFSLTPLTFLLGFVIFDFLYYLMHRASHTSALLWTGHCVHHQSNNFNLTVGFRQGIIPPLLTFPFFLPLAILGFDVESLLLISSVNAGLQFFGHTEYLNNLGVLDKILMTPRNHRVHHSRAVEHHNSNYGGVLLVWDLLFKSYKVPEKQVTSYGLTVPFRSSNVFAANYKPLAEYFGVSTNTEKTVSIQTQMRWQIQLYVLIQFLILFNFTLYSILNTDISIYRQLLSISMITLGLFTLSGVLEQKKYFIPLDLLRFILMLAVFVLIY